MGAKRSYAYFEVAGRDALDYIIVHYNPMRGHSFNNDLSPDEAENRVLATVTMHRTT